MRARPVDPSWLCRVVILKITTLEKGYAIIQRFIAGWEAMNLLTEVNTHQDAPQLKGLLADAEGALCRLTIELARRANP